MKLSFPLAMVVLASGFGCATKPPPEYQSVPDASNVDTSLAMLATETGRQAYGQTNAPTKEAPANETSSKKVGEAKKPKAEKAKPKPKAQKPADTSIISPDSSHPGTVMSYNEAGRFVVLNFPSAVMPAIGERMFIYRNGLKVAEVKITGPKRDDNIVADLVSGEARAKDEVRNK